MIDKKKVINGLEKCKRCECDDCTEKNASQVPWDCPAYDDFVDSALALLKEQPEIIYCKDCKYGRPMCQPWEDIICAQNRATHIPDWFCAEGKRR